MKYSEATEEVERLDRKLLSLYTACYDQACMEVGGNWQEPDVQRRRRERAEQIADERLKDVKINIDWQV